MPRRLHFGGHQVDVLETLDQWYGLTTDTSPWGTDGGLYILRFDGSGRMGANDVWVRRHKRAKIGHDGRAERTANCGAETRELGRLVRMLEERGAEAIPCPMIAIRDAPDEEPVAARLRWFVKGV